jgi:hypothetical protein
VLIATNRPRLRKRPTASAFSNCKYLTTRDDEGRVRASIMVHPPDPTAAPPSGGTAILRLIDEDGRPSVKLATTKHGGGLALAGDSEGTYVQLWGHGLAVTKDGRQQLIP